MANFGSLTIQYDIQAHVFITLRLLDFGKNDFIYVVSYITKTNLSYSGFIPPLLTSTKPSATNSSVTLISPPNGPFV